MKLLETLADYGAAFAVLAVVLSVVSLGARSVWRKLAEWGDRMITFWIEHGKITREQHAAGIAELRETRSAILASNREHETADVDRFHKTQSGIDHLIEENRHDTRGILQPVQASIELKIEETKSYLCERIEQVEREIREHRAEHAKGASTR